jgi:hypothetical protein
MQTAKSDLTKSKIDKRFAQVIGCPTIRLNVKLLRPIT